MCVCVCLFLSSGSVSGSGVKEQLRVDAEVDIRESRSQPPEPCSELQESEKAPTSGLKYHE